MLPLTRPSINTTKVIEIKKKADAELRADTGIFFSIAARRWDAVWFTRLPTTRQIESGDIQSSTGIGSLNVHQAFLGPCNLATVPMLRHPVYVVTDAVAAFLNQARRSVAQVMGKPSVVRAADALEIFL